MDVSSRFVPNPQARIAVRPMGREGHALLTVDDAFENPEALVERACRTPFAAPHITQYPGLNAPLPEDYSQGLIHALRPMLQSAFGIPPHLPLSFFGFFALATQSPEDLKPVQKVPHQDSTDPFKIAMVHYLCKGPQGGTGFYRHEATGFESVDAAQRAQYVAAVSDELASRGDQLTRHAGRDTPGYEMIDFAEAAFNRLIVYRSHCLHSGLLEQSTLTADPATGRLTANSFLEVTR